MAGPGDPRSPREPADPLNVNHLLLIGAYRDNEASGSHPLVRKLNAIRQAGGRTQEVPLRPLAQGDLGQLIADAVPCAPEQASGLAELVREKTAGNPLFAIQFLSTAHGGRLWVEANVLRGATFKFMLPAA